VILDLRAPEGWASGGMVDYLLNTSRLPGSILPLSIALPTERTRIYEGYPPDNPGLGATFYRSGWQVPSGTVIPGSHSNAVRPVIFLVNPWSELPTLAFATRAAGAGRVIGEGERSRALGATTRLLPLVERLVVELRVSELISAEGTEVPTIDTLVPAATERDDPALALALRWSVAPHLAPAPSRPALPVSASPGTSVPEPLAFPGPGERLVGLFRLWGAIEYFHAYPDLYGGSWGTQLERFIPRMEQAGDSVKYALAIAELMTHTHDSHGFVQAPGLNAYYGGARLPLIARMIEGRPIVTHIVADSLAPGVRPGDEIVRIDGEPMGERLNRVSRYVAASNKGALQRDALAAALRGHGPAATLVLRGADARLRTVRVVRLETPAERPREKPATGRSGPILRLLPGNIGYADLDRLSSDMVDSMFTMFRGTKGIVFDMRGYPNGTAWQIAPRLTDRPRVAAALFTERIARSPRGILGNETDEALERSFVQYLPAGGDEPYRGWTVMLIDERTQSQAEHTGLFFEAANGTKFVGSRTAGTDGDVTNVALPGDILVWFTGLAVRHADGRPLQRVGLAPDIPARPTIRGIRAGRDEVLERALSYLRGLPPRRGKQ
jgi:C-terminal processing protease CtpA/Prc